MRKLTIRIRFASALVCLSLLSTFVLVTPANTTVSSRTGLAVIKGVVRDNGGNPIADATVAIFRAGTSSLLKQVQSGSDGSFLARIAPGTYTVLAVAQGFNPVTLSEVEVLQSAQLTYGFKLERAGSGNTLPEKRIDRNNPKWVRRSATISRSIYQNTEGDGEVLADATEAQADDDDETGRKVQSVAETYFSGSENAGFAGLNFATLLPVTDDAEVVIAAQTGVGRNAPQRFETQVRFRPSGDHQIRVNTAFGKLGTVVTEGGEGALGQISLRATDEWKVREGLIFVYGFDYSRFVGVGDDFALSPRLGLQYDLNAKTRVRTAFTTQTEQPSWSRVVELENAEVIFREPIAVQDFVIESGKPKMNRSQRLEFGFERVLDNSSSLDANFFFDTTFSRGVGITPIAFASPAGAVFEDFVGNQQGDARGFTLVYNRRINGRISTAAGYSFGRGQSISEGAIENPADLFENGSFQSFFGQIEADLRTGTNVKTVFRLSPQATVFAIDPFQGRLAIYDPSMSVLVTQNLPTLGLPFHAQAIMDARNIFDFQSGLNGEEGGLRINGQGRSLRGGILVRF